MSLPPKVKKLYKCPVCQIQHEIAFDADLAKNQPKFPFGYIYLHKYQTSNPLNFEEVGIDILTTLYLDGDLNIRGVEAIKLLTTDIFSKEDTAAIIQKMSNHVQELQQALDEMTRKYNELLIKTQKK